MDEHQRAKHRTASIGGPEEQRAAALTRARAEGYRQKIFAFPYGVVKQLELPFDVEDKWEHCLLADLDRDKMRFSPLEIISLGHVHGGQDSRRFDLPRSIPRAMLDALPENATTEDRHSYFRPRVFFLACENAIDEFAIRSQNGIYVHRVVHYTDGGGFISASPADINYRLKDQ